MNQTVLPEGQKAQLKDQGNGHADKQHAFGTESMEEEIDEIQLKGKAEIPINAGRHRVNADEIAQQRKVNGIPDVRMKTTQPHELIEQGAEKDSWQHEQEQFQPAMLEVVLDVQGRRTLFVFLDESVAGQENKDGDTDPSQEREDFAQRIPKTLLEHPSQKLLCPPDIEGTLILGGKTEPGLVQEVMKDDADDRQPLQFIALFSGKRH